MASFNKVVLVGNLTRDPDLRTFPSGSIVARIGLAVNERSKDQNGNWTDVAYFFDAEAWNRNAEVLRDYTSKGSSILVEGSLKQDTWEQEGQKRSKVLIRAERIVLLGGRNEGTNNNNNGYQQQGGYQQQNSGYRRQQPQYQSNSSPEQGYARSNDGYSQEGADEIPF